MDGERRLNHNVRPVTEGLGLGGLNLKGMVASRNQKRLRAVLAEIATGEAVWNSSLGDFWKWGKKDEDSFNRELHLRIIEVAKSVAAGAVVHGESFLFENWEQKKQEIGSTEDHPAGGNDADAGAAGRYIPPTIGVRFWVELFLLAPEVVEWPGVPAKTLPRLFWLRVHAPVVLEEFFEAALSFGKSREFFALAMAVVVFGTELGWDVVADAATSASRTSSTADASGANSRSSSVGSSAPQRITDANSADENIPGIGCWSVVEQQAVKWAENAEVQEEVRPGVFQPKITPKLHMISAWLLKFKQAATFDLLLKVVARFPDVNIQGFAFERSLNLLTKQEEEKMRFGYGLGSGSGIGAGSAPGERKRRPPIARPSVEEVKVEGTVSRDVALSMSSGIAGIKFVAMLRRFSLEAELKAIAEHPEAISSLVYLLGRKWSIQKRPSESTHFFSKNFLLALFVLVCWYVSSTTRVTYSSGNFYPQNSCLLDVRSWVDVRGEQTWINSVWVLGGRFVSMRAMSPGISAIMRGRCRTIYSIAAWSRCRCIR